MTTPPDAMERLARHICENYMAWGASCHGRLALVYEALTTATAELRQRAETAEKRVKELEEVCHGLIDYVLGKYPGEEIRCPHIRAIAAALSTPAPSVTGVDNPPV